MVLGPLLAGNGLMLATVRRLRPLARLLLDCLRRAGVPGAVLRMAPGDLPDMLSLLAGDMFHFAETDLPLEQTLQVYRWLGETREAEGQTWVKALIAMQEGPRPGEPGFLRLFALPRTIAIRTLRHGAELDLPVPDEVE